MGMFKTAMTGAAWTTVSTVVRSIVSLLQVSILTRFLDKADFGIVAIAVLFIGFSSIFLDLGLSIGIMHKQEISRNEYSSLFWLNIFTGLFLSSLMVLIAPIISRAYNDPQLTPIIQLLSLNMLFASIGNQHRTVQQKKLRFKLISIVEITSSVLTIVVAVSTAYAGFGVYSLVYSSLFATLCPNILFLIIGLSKDNNIYFHFTWKDTFPFLKIGAYNIAGQTLDYFAREVDIIIISATLGKESLGIYSLCKKLVTALYSAVMPIYNKVLVPLMAKLQNDVNNARKVTYDVIESVAITNFPIFLLLAVFPGFIIHFLYGDDYMNGIYVLSILAVHYAFLSPGSPASALLVAFGRTDRGFYWTICRIIIYAVFSYIGALFSIEGMVAGIFVGSLLSAPLGWVITIKPIIGGDFWGYFNKKFYPFVISIIISLPFFWLFHQETRMWMVVIAAVVYIICSVIIASVLFREAYIVQKGKELLKRFMKFNIINNERH